MGVSASGRRCTGDKLPHCRCDVFCCKQGLPLLTHSSRCGQKVLDHVRCIGVWKAVQLTLQACWSVLRCACDAARSSLHLQRYFAVFGVPWYYIPNVWLTLCMLCIGLLTAIQQVAAGLIVCSHGQGLTGFINASRGFWREKHAWGQAEGIHILACPTETGTEVFNSDRCCASAVRDLQCTVVGIRHSQ